MLGAHQRFVTHLQTRRVGRPTEICDPLANATCWAPTIWIRTKCRQVSKWCTGAYISTCGRRVSRFAPSDSLTFQWAAGACHFLNLVTHLYFFVSWFVSNRRSFLIDCFVEIVNIPSLFLLFRTWPDVVVRYILTWNNKMYQCQTWYNKTHHWKLPVSVMWQKPDRLDITCSADTAVTEIAKSHVE